MPSHKKTRPPELPTVERICLKCTKEFQSSGNRICPECTVENSKVGIRVGRGASRHVGGLERRAKYD